MQRYSPAVLGIKKETKDSLGMGFGGKGSIGACVLGGGGGLKNRELRTQTNAKFERQRCLMGVVRGRAWTEG